MRRRTGLAAAAVVLSMFLTPLGCGRGKAGEKESAAKAPARKKSTPPWQAEAAPVTVEFAGFTPDKESARYRIHVVSDKPLSQVDVAFKYTGADGKEQRGTVVWQNAVDSKRLPIEKGKDYEGQTHVGRGASNVTFKALHVAFMDMTNWVQR